MAGSVGVEALLLREVQTQKASLLVFMPIFVSPRMYISTDQSARA